VSDLAELHVTLCEADRALPRTSCERPHFGNRAIFLEDDHGLAIQHAMKIRVRILLHFFHGDGHRR
jgi:hypothetical protein